MTKARTLLEPSALPRTIPIENLTFKNWWHLLARHTSAVGPNETIGTALKIMVHRGFRHLPIVRRDANEFGSEILGMISAGDVIDLIGSGDLLPSLGEPVSNMMNDNPVVVSSEDTILDAIRTISEKNIGALLIEEDNCDEIRHQSLPNQHRLQGIVTLRDIVSIMAAYAPFGLLIKDYMTRGASTICENDSIWTAVDIMAEKKVRRLPVVSARKKDHVAGMLTNKMILRYLESVIAYNIQDVNAALTMPVTSAPIASMPLIDPMEDCGNALYLMRELGTGGFAVLDSRGLLGVITERDLVRRIYIDKGLSFFSELFLQDRKGTIPN